MDLTVERATEPTSGSAPDPSTGTTHQGTDGRNRPQVVCGRCHERHEFWVHHVSSD
jgi:hypothetical protein